MIDCKHTGEHDNGGEKNGYPEKAECGPDCALMVRVKDNDSNNDRVEGDWDSSEVARLREVCNDGVGDVRVYEQAKQTHDGEENEEEHIEHPEAVSQVMKPVRRVWEIGEQLNDNAFFLSASFSKRCLNFLTSSHGQHEPRRVECDDSFPPILGIRPCLERLRRLVPRHFCDVQKRF